MKQRLILIVTIFCSGSHVAILLVTKYPQYKVVVLDKIDYCSSLQHLAEIEHLPNFSFVKGSITSPDLVNYVLRNEKIDTVMHFAAQTHVDNSFGNSFTFTETNVLGTHVLLEAAKAAKVKKFIHVSTDEVYGDGVAGNASAENSMLDPTNPYAATKAAAEYLVKAYHRSFQLPIIITRGNNVYGPHQYPEKIIPKFILQMMKNKPLTMHGNGQNTRNFLYVKDVADAFDVILHKGEIGQIYNIGGVNEFSNIEVARELLRLFGKVEEAGSMALAEKKHLTWVPDRAFNDLRYNLNSDRLRRLGWTESTSWEAGIRQTMQWYFENHNRWANVETALAAHPLPSLRLPEMEKGENRLSSRYFEEEPTCQPSPYAKSTSTSKSTTYQLSTAGINSAQL